MQQEVSFVELKARFLSMPEAERIKLLLDHQHVMRQVGDPLIEVAVVQRAQQLGMRRAAVLTPSSAAKKQHRFSQRQQESDPLAELQAISDRARKRQQRQQAPCNVIEPEAIAAPPAPPPKPPKREPVSLAERMEAAFARNVEAAA